MNNTADIGSQNPVHARLKPQALSVASFHGVGNFITSAMDGAHLKLRSKFQRPFFTSNSEQPIHTQESSPQTPPIIAMHEDDNLNSDDVSAPQEPWSTPASQVHMPATSLAGFSYCIPTDHSSHPSMETISGPYGTPQDTPSRPVSTHQEFSSHFEENYWMQKPFESQYPFHGMADVPIGQAFTSDEAISVLDLEHQGLPASFQLNLDDVQSRRISGSSFSLSTSGALSDIQSYDDFSAALSDAPSFYSEMPPKSNRTSWMSSTQLSPVASPRLAPSTRSDLVRTQSRGRASPSPRPNVRSAPYMIEGPRNAKRWSTGSYGNMANRRSAPSSMYHAAPDAHMMHQPTSQPPFFMNCPPIPQRNSMLLPTQLPSQLPSQPLTTDTRHFDAPAPLLSHGLLRMLQSNADAHALHSRYADLSDPPDLFGALSEEQAPPPEEDLHPEDPEMTPREQDLRFEGDLYTPRWVRGHGNKREGWCGICKPGRWLVLKNSAYWYDKSFSHGVSAATGAQFQEPLETRRMDGNPDVWEGLCSSCDEWIALVSSKKKGTTWFRHAYKCHSHPKAKDSAKRRRESGPGKGAGTPTASKVCKTEPQQPVTPHLPSSSVVNTPMSSTPGYQMPCSHSHSHPHSHSHHYMPLAAQPQALLTDEHYPHMI